MIDSKRRSINEGDDELGDKLEIVSIILIGQYRKGIRLERIGQQGSIIGHEVRNRQSQEYDMKLYRDYFSEHPTYPAQVFLGVVFE
jgi:hypothetical protein